MFKIIVTGYKDSKIKGPEYKRVILAEMKEYILLGNKKRFEKKIANLPQEAQKALQSIRHKLLEIKMTLDKRRRKRERKNG